MLLKKKKKLCYWHRNRLDHWKKRVQKHGNLVHNKVIFQVNGQQNDGLSGKQNQLAQTIHKRDGKN